MCSWQVAKAASKMTLKSGEGFTVGGSEDMEVMEVGESVGWVGRWREREPDGKGTLGYES